MATSPGLGSLCATCWRVASGKSLHLAQPQFHRLERGGWQRYLPHRGF